jgi:cytochrome c oxidase cbb3-type subunit I/II
MEIQQFNYDNKTVKYFIMATMIWGAVALLVGLLIALQLAFPAFNLGIEYTTFGRTRPLHTTTPCNVF